MTGFGGDDTYYFDSAADTAVEAADGGTDTVHASVTDTMNANVENLILDGRRQHRRHRQRPRQHHDRQQPATTR